MNMKINKYHIASISDNPDVQENITKTYLDKNLINQPQEVKRDVERQFNEVFKKTNRNRYLLNPSALSVINTLKTDSFRPSFLLNKKSEGFRADYIVSETEVFKLVLLNGEWLIMNIVFNRKTERISYTTFKLYPSRNAYSQNTSDDGIIQKFDLFVKCLMFVEFTDPEMVTLPPGGKHGTQKQGKFKNETTNKFIIVGSKWNWISIRTDGFLVRGHFRWQPCGIKNQDRKLIFVDGFEKQGYTRKNKIA